MLTLDFAVQSEPAHVQTAESEGEGEKEKGKA